MNNHFSPHFNLFFDELGSEVTTTYEIVNTDNIFDKVVNTVIREEFAQLGTEITRINR